MGAPDVSDQDIALEVHIDILQLSASETSAEMAQDSLMLI